MKDKDTISFIVVAGIVLIWITIATYLTTRNIKESKIENKQEKVDTFLYQGHTMVKFTNGKSISICHSPECRKCTLFYD